MAYTQLQLAAIPGKRHAFLAKTEAAIAAGPHTGTFTELAVLAVPGARHSFTAKPPASVPVGPHTGLFTALSSLALPGMRHLFTSKSVAEEVIHGGDDRLPQVQSLRKPPYAVPAWRQAYDNSIFQMDTEILDLVKLLLASRILK